MRKPTSYLVLLTLLGSILLTGCINNQNFDVHEWGVFVKGYGCNNVSALGKSPEVVIVYKPVIYFHNLKNRTSVEVEISSIKNASTIPDAEIKNDHIIWNVNVENDTIFSSNGTEHSYLFYEGEINYPTKVVADITVIGDNVTFHVKNNENYTITDIYMVYGYGCPTDKMSFIRIRRSLTYVKIDKLDSGEEANITTHLKNDTYYETDSLLASLIEGGLTEEEAQELINYWKNWWFYPTNLGNHTVSYHWKEDWWSTLFGVYTRLIYTIPQSVYDQLLPITVTPKPSSIVRVGIVTITDIPVLDLGNLSLTISTDRDSYQVNDSINISLRITNRGDKDINLTFPDAQVADFEIVSENGERVYLWSSGRMFAQVITTLRVPARESIELLNETWRADIGGGNYTIMGWLPSTPKIYSAPTTIKIE
ncbi:MAG: hypothetical protein J7K13_00020 [Thermoplasmata archaeon]|nr:hypothetical protein [Thermoplasmata archaeon]